MAQTLKHNSIDELPRAPASDLKKIGWRGVMKTVMRKGKVVVTNYNEPEAVILSIAEYEAIERSLQEAAARTEPALDALRKRFDERLASLRQPDADKRLRDLIRGPARLEGEVKAGAGY